MERTQALVELIKGKPQFSVFRRGDSVLLLNPAVNCWTVMTGSDYQRYCELEQRDFELGGRGDLHGKYTDILLKMHIEGMFPQNSITAGNRGKCKLGKIAQRPIVYWGQTPDCNLACTYCYANAGLVQGGGEAVHPEVLQALLKSNPEYVAFTGGEPLLVDGVFNAARKLQEHHIRTELISNGVLVKKFPVDWYNYFDSITLSLDGHTDKLNAATRGRGNYNKVVDAIKYLQKLRKRININVTVTSENYAHIGRIMEFIYGNLNLTKLRFCISVGLGRGQGSGTLLSRKQLRDFPLYSFGYYLDSLRRFRHIEKIKISLIPNTKKSRCSLGLTEFFVDQLGKVYSCRLFCDDKHYLGNILETPLADLSGREPYPGFNALMDNRNYKQCSLCVLQSLCGGGCRANHAAACGKEGGFSGAFCGYLKNETEMYMWLAKGHNPITGEKLARELYV